MKLFDYIFFRIYIYYERKKYIPKSMGIFFNSLFQLVILFIFCELFIRIVFHEPHFFKTIDKTLFNLIFGFVTVLIFSINIFRYNINRINFLLEKYNHNRFNKIIATWMIFLFPVFLFVATIFLMIELK